MNTETPLPDLHQVPFYCLRCDAPSWAREWTILDPGHALVELAAECPHIALTHIVAPEQILTRRETGELAILIEIPADHQLRRDVAQCRAVASTTGRRCRNDAGLDGLCHHHQHQGSFYRQELPLIEQEPTP